MHKFNVLVDTRWLLNHLKDPNIKVIEISGPFVPYNFYGHIPGSIVLDWRQHFWHKKMRDFVKDDFEKLMSLIGVSNSTTVICCSLGKQFMTYVFWIFKLFGHKDVRILDGGLAKWMYENLPLERKARDLAIGPTTAYNAGEPDNEIRVFRDYVLNCLKRDDVIIIDARSPQEFEGKLINAPGLVQEGAYCSGHIPRSVNIHFEENFRQDGLFKSINELREIYHRYGVSSDKEVITYCRTGHRASVTWFVLKCLLNFPRVRLYDGSWTEWGNLVSAPIE